MSLRGKVEGLVGDLGGWKGLLYLVFLDIQHHKQDIAQ